MAQGRQFTHLGASKRKRRVDRPDFQIITDEQHARLRRCARESRTDDYGLALEGATMSVGETAMRPREIFGLHRPEVHMDTRMIHVRRQLDLATGEVTWPKEDGRTLGAHEPALYAHFQRMPRMGKVIHEELGEIMFPSVRGGYMRRSQWCALWNAIRRRGGDARSGLLRAKAPRDPMGWSIPSQTAGSALTRRRSPKSSATTTAAT